ncbi:MAG: HepT-like ribonuclease domain-containing protein [Merismopediaceae bacterium]|nr:HepT-like ribonuclease domain-containing protein [Merismopediaceae bacterium]
MRNDWERLRDIQEALIQIDKYTNQGKAAFLDNELIQGWVLLHLQRIGEAARAMAKTTHQQYPQIPWQDIIDFRNILVHEYFRIDLELVWQIVETELPLLTQEINQILQNSD